jgi:hypothetical protein
VNINNLDHNISHAQTISAIITSTTPIPTTSTQKVSTTTKSIAIKLPTTLPTSKPKYYITTTPRAIMMTTRNENRPKQPPFDPMNPLDGLRPGIFAGIILYKYFDKGVKKIHFI